MRLHKKVGVDVDRNFKDNNVSLKSYAHPKARNLSQRCTAKSPLSKFAKFDSDSPVRCSPR